jgi:hypothetical protein
VVFLGFFFLGGDSGERGVPKLPKLTHLPAPHLYDD